MSNSFFESMESRKMFSVAGADTEPVMTAVQATRETGNVYVCVKPQPGGHDAGLNPSGPIFSDTIIIR